MKNKILSAIISIVLMISLVGCQQNNTIIKPNVETKKVTENSQLDLVTFTFESPDSWTSVAADKDSLICRSPSSNESEEYKNYISQDYLVISNYTTMIFCRYQTNTNRAMKICSKEHMTE